MHPDTRSTETPGHGGARDLGAALVRRWPLAAGLLAALVLFLTGGTGAQARAGLATAVVIAVSCYLAAAASSRPWMAWAWIPGAVVVVVVARLLDVDPVLLNAVAAVALVAVGLLRGAARPETARQTAALVGYGLLVLAALSLGPGPGLVVAAGTLIGHGGWDLWHLTRRRGVVSPSLAEACVALDVPIGLAVLVVAVLA